MGDNNKKICPCCKGTVRSGKKCPNCGCLFHNSCVERQLKSGKWLCCMKRSKHSLLHNTRFNGMNLTLSSVKTQPSSSSASAAAGGDDVDLSVVMDTSQSDTHDITCKQEATASLVDGASNFSIHQAPQKRRPTDIAQQASGITKAF